MEVKLIIVFLTHAVIANDLVSSNVVEVPTLVSNKDPSSENQHAVNTIYKHQVPSQAPGNNYDSVIELQKEDPSPCYGTTVLIPILNQLLSILMQDPSYENRVARISALLKEYLHKILEHENKNAQVNNINEAPKDVLRSGFNEPIAKAHVKTKIVFKYDLPSINQPTCKDAFMRLIKSAYDAYMELAKNPMCQNAGALEEMIKKFYYTLQKNPSNYVPNDNNKPVYNIYDLLAPNQLNKDVNNVLLQDHNKYINVLPYGDFKPVTDTPNKYADNLDSIINIIQGLDKPKPNVNDINGYEKNINILTPDDVQYQKLYSNPTENLNPNANINIYDFYSNSNHRKPQDNWQITENNWNLPSNVFSNKNQSPLDSILSILDVKKPKGNLEDKTIEFGYDKLPNYNQIDPYQNLNQLPSKYQNAGLPSQIYNNLDINLSPQQQVLTQYSQPLYNYISNQYGIPFNKLSVTNPYLQNAQNNYFNKLAMLPNLQQYYGVSNGFKLDPSVNGVIELTFVLKRATPLIYQPLYFVKFRIPYSTFLINMQSLILRNPQLKVNPLKLYQELIALSNVSDISPSLKGYNKEDILRLTYKNGELVTAKLLKDDNGLNDQLKSIQSLNAGIGAADIWKLASKNNGLVKHYLRNGTESNVARNGNVFSSIYDLSSSGIGFNYDPSHSKIMNSGIRPTESLGTQTTLFSGSDKKPSYDGFPLRV